MSITPEERIREFIEAALILEKNKFYPACLSGTLHLGLGIVDGSHSMTMSLTNVDIDSLKSFLVTFRKFTMKKETVCFSTVHRAALKLRAESPMVRWVEASRKRVIFARDTGWPMRVSIPGVSCKPIDLFKLWMYGHPELFHRTETGPERLKWDRLKNWPNGPEMVTSVALQFIRKWTREAIHFRKLMQRYGAVEVPP